MTEDHSELLRLKIWTKQNRML